MKVLAFQADQVAGQTCGYFPDSTANTFDKLNVRQGRYDIWGPLHFITAVDGGGNPLGTSNPGRGGQRRGQAFVNLVTLPAGDDPQRRPEESVIPAAASGARRRPVRDAVQSHHRGRPPGLLRPARAVRLLLGVARHRRGDDVNLHRVHDGHRLRRLSHPYLPLRLLRGNQ